MKRKGIISGAARWFVDRMLGLSYLQLASVYFAAIVLFGIAYDALFLWMPEHGPSIPGHSEWMRLLNAIYFSTITATSVGYGDILPHGFSKILAGVESFFALFVFGILIAKPISERQENAVYQMHKLTLDDIFNSIREGFFIMRKDFDAIIDEVDRTKNLSKRSMENLETALRHGHILIDDIPTFYDTEKQLYVIDARREKLLAEAVERTFHRILRVLSELNDKRVDWQTDRPVQTALLELLAITRNILGKWQKHSSKNIHADLTKVKQTIEQIEKMM